MYYLFVFAMKQRGFNHPPPRLTADTLHSQKRAVAASLLQACYLVVIKPIPGRVRISCSRLITRFLHVVKGGFSFFSQEGRKYFRWSASHIQYAILDASGEA